MMIQFSLRRFIKALVLTILISVVPATFVLACNTVPIVLAKAEIMTLDQAVNSVRKSQKAKILSAETLHVDGQPIHVIKILTKSGHVKKIRINPQVNR